MDYTAGPQPGPRLRFHLVSLGFALLYDRMAWAYDAVSWLASLGRWRRWQVTVLPHLPTRGWVLDLACGPGHLSASLEAAGYHTVAFDVSTGMIRLARRRLRQPGDGAAIVQGHATALPFAPGSFKAIVCTFPTPFAHDPKVHQQLWRVLKPAGRLVVATQAGFTGRRPLTRFMEWLYRITGQRGPAPDLSQSLAAAGFVARRMVAHVDGTAVTLVVADKPA